ncbi:MAG: VOC family protein [Nocardioides sp.]
MPLATYQDLCIDVADARVEGAFWASTLGWRLEMHDDGDARLHDADGRIQVWLNRVPEPKTVKNRVHVDVNAESVRQVLDAGATPFAEFERWTTLADPDGQEFCVFVRDEPIEQRFYELEWDCAEGADASRDQAVWWQGVLGGDVVDDERGYSWLEQIPSAPFYSMDFVGVPESKTAKNRVHIDVTTDDVDALVAHGARLLRRPDDEIGWHVLADPDGNEFCAFASEQGTQS